jgi:NitT/TauT family transport system ATP-binding protein
MDEPFGSLDYTTRYYVRDRLLDIWERAKVTILLVSHDIDEAIYLADRVALLTKRPARIIEVLESNLPRPRSVSILEKEEFFVLKKRALQLFKRALDNEV